MERLIACRVCGLTQSIPHLTNVQQAECARCGERLLRENSFHRAQTAAFSLAALLLYVPANIYPVMTMHYLGRETENTVWGGTRALWRDGMWGVAVIVFLASILVPLLKLLGLFYLVTVQHSRHQKLRTKIFIVSGFGENQPRLNFSADDRWTESQMQNLSIALGRYLSISDFEVVQSTGPLEGPRSPGAPVANAGPDVTVGPGATVTLQGSVSFSNLTPVVRWKQYSGPGTVAFENTAKLQSKVTFSTNGVYTLMLSADDGVHAVAYDAVVITVTSNIQLTITRSGTNALVSWLGGNPPYVLQKTTALPGPWKDALTTSLQTVTLPLTNRAEFYRVRGQ